MTFTHDDDISNLCTLVPILSEPQEKEYVSQASQGSGKTTASCKGRRGRPPSGMRVFESFFDGNAKWVCSYEYCVLFCSVRADVAMINSSSALGESVQLQKQFHDFYAGTSQADDNDEREEVRAFIPDVHTIASVRGDTFLSFMSCTDAAGD